MELTINRKTFSENSVISEMLIDEIKECLILEDKDRDLNQDGKNEIKIYGKSAIPYGKYKVVLQPWGRIHESYIKKDWAKAGHKGFEKIYCGQIHIVGIQDFDGVHIHIGTKIEDTLGCPLTGTTANLQKDPFTLSRSTDAYVKFYTKIVEPIKKAGFIWLNVVKDPNATYLK